MKTYEELARGALARAEKEKKRRKKQNRIIISGVVLVFAVTAAVLIIKHPWLRGKAGDIETVPAGTAAAVSQAVPDENASTQTPGPSGDAVPTTAATAEAVPEPADGTQAETETPSGTDTAGDIFGGETPYTGAVSEYIFTGDAVTEAEAAAYFAEHLNGILTSLISSGVNARGAQIRFPGYSHMTLGQPGDVRLNYRDYQLWLDGTLLSVITLYKPDGEICAAPSFGATWFASFAAFLRQHRGEKLLFFYNGFTELVLTPENAVYAPVTGPCENPGLDYNTLYCDEIAFIP